jgi:hypothetical protein
LQFIHIRASPRALFGPGFFPKIAGPAALPEPEVLGALLYSRKFCQWRLLWRLARAALADLSCWRRNCVGKSQAHNLRLSGCGCVLRGQVDRPYAPAPGARYPYAPEGFEIADAFFFATSACLAASVNLGPFA